MTHALWAVLPGGIDDPAAPSGGNRYDRAVLTLLSEARDVYEIAVPGSWPTPGERSRFALSRALDGIPDGSDVLVTALDRHVRGLDWQCTFGSAIRGSVRRTGPRIDFRGRFAGDDLDDGSDDADPFGLASRA